MDKNIIRVKKNRDNPFVMMDKRIFCDTGLSWKAKGILGYLLSKPDDWEIRISDLVNQSTDGRDAVYAGIKELRKSGYIVRESMRGDKGKIVRWEYIVFETPMDSTTSGFSVSGSATSGFSRSGFAVSGKSDTTNTDDTNIFDHNNNNEKFQERKKAFEAYRKEIGQ